jgi:EmrB/QacA subfamily drug resistance transporter
VFTDRLSPKVSVAIVFVMAMFMTIMDITIVNVALPQMAVDFNVSPDHIDSVVVSYLVSLAVFIPASGWLGDRFGMKRVLLVAILVFTTASALCGLAQTLGQLDAFRILQGAGGGMLTPVGMALLFRTFPPEERVRASRILIVPTAFAPAIGPVLGGLLVTKVSWRWVFFVNLPLGLIAVTFGALFVREYKATETAGRFDVGGFLLAGSGLAAAMYALSEGPSHGWTSPLILTLGAVGVVLLVSLVFYELRREQPLIDMRVFNNRLFSRTTGTLFVTVAAFLGSLYLIALFYQDGLGLTALGSGLSTFPEAIGVMIGAQSATRLYAVHGPRRVMTVGLVALAAFIGSFAFVGYDTSLWVARTLMFCVGLSIAHVFVPCQAASFATISPAATGRASTVFNTARQVGGALGVAVLTTVISAVGVTHLSHGHVTSNLAAFHWAFAVAAVIALSATAITWGIHDSDAAATMRPRAVIESDPALAELAPVPEPTGS